MQKEQLYGKTLNELIAVAKRIGLPGFAAKQIADWLYKKEIKTIGEMTNLSIRMRDILSEEYEIGLVRSGKCFREQGWHKKIPV